MLSFTVREKASGVTTAIEAPKLRNTSTQMSPARMRGKGAAGSGSDTMRAADTAAGGRRTASATTSLNASRSVAPDAGEVSSDDVLFTTISLD